MSWSKREMVISDGQKVSAQEPVIISASRSTDIPAFYSDWFLERLRAGYCNWVNPYNREVFRVSFEGTRMIVFWSKNPKPMMERLDELEALGFKNYYFQFTLNDYVREGLESNVPPVEERIETFKALAKRLGKERVIWRYDPLILSDDLTVDALLERIACIGRELRGSTEKLVFSFADILSYRKVNQEVQERQGPAQSVWLCDQQGHRYVQYLPASLQVLLCEFVRGCRSCQSQAA